MMLLEIVGACLLISAVTAYVARRLAPSRGRPPNQWMWLGLWGPFMLAWRVFAWPRKKDVDA